MYICDNVTVTITVTELHVTQAFIQIPNAKPVYYYTDVLELILLYEDFDVDPVNRMDKATPLHISARIKAAESHL